jgi:hypothetical protein
VYINPNIYRPLASHSFGWVDGMAINKCPGWTGRFKSQSTDKSCPLPALNILVRGESDDPWASDTQQLEVWTLSPNPEYYTSLDCVLTSSVSLQLSPPTGGMVSRTGHPSTSASRQQISPPSQPSVSASPSFPPFIAPDPGSSASHATTTSDSISPPPYLSPYIFPPTLTTTIPCLYGALRYKQVALGRFGTGVWIRPPARQGWRTGDWAHLSAYAGSADLGLTVLTEDVSSAGGGNGMLPSALGSLSLDGRGRNSDADSEVLVGVVLNQYWAREGGEAADEWEERDQEVNTVTHLSPDQARASVGAVPIFANDTATSWSALDYDEVCGRVVLASSFGRVFILEL